MSEQEKFTADENRVSLAWAKDWLRKRVRKGSHCPCCGQFAKVYRRALPSASAAVLVALHRAGGYDEGTYHFLPDVLDKGVGSRTAQQGGYGILSQHWGLIEKKPGKRDDGSDRVGYWRLTGLGHSFVLEEVLVPKFALIYNGRCMKTEGPQIGIRQALGKKFHYDELMGG